MRPTPSSPSERYAATAEVEVNDTDLLMRISGPSGSVLRELSRTSEVAIGLRGNVIRIAGEREPVESTKALIAELLIGLESGTISDDDMLDVIKAVRPDSKMKLNEVYEETVLTTDAGRIVAPRTANQRDYLRALRRHDIVFGVGPAGTGKTYLAVAMAVQNLNQRRVKRIVLTRPAVEAGERLGFLPGDLVEKINPYLRPLYDALYDMLGAQKTTALLERGTIEIAPLAFMRGRTLNESFVILDEAQNTTVEQMKMFLTRLGVESKAVITGDVTQVDLPRDRKSGLRNAIHVLRDIEGIQFCKFEESDVVRHPLVQRIVKAYAREEEAPHD
ncbi:MAG: PhoH family protein [Polyangiales bacterium]